MHTCNILCYRILTPLEKVLSGLEDSKRNPNLRVNESPGKGRGVVSEVDIDAGDFVLEYRTKEVYPHKELQKHVRIYDLNDECCYVLEVQTKEGWVCLDATRKVGTLGRLLNHSSRPNLKPFRPLHVRGKWRAGFIALCPIKAGEELLWDYGCPPEGQKWLYRHPQVPVDKVCTCPTL